jgi:hypothetical protein
VRRAVAAQRSLAPTRLADETVELPVENRLAAAAVRRAGFGRAAGSQKRLRRVRSHRLRAGATRCAVRDRAAHRRGYGEK